MNSSIKTFKLLLPLYARRLEDECYSDAILHFTGSISSDVKVGYPHEADFILEIHPRHPRINIRSFALYKTVQEIVDTQMGEILAGVHNIIIHGAVDHNVGACLIMEYRPDHNCNKGIGITVDLVPVWKVTELVDCPEFNKDAWNRELPKVNQGQFDQLTPHADKYKSSTFDRLVESGQIFRLEGRYECDMGIVENSIIRELSTNQKRAFRVAKYIIQYLETDRSYPGYAFDSTLDDESVPSIFGYSPVFKSYWLRVLFLHLIIQSKDTTVENELKYEKLVLCILDLCDFVASTTAGIYANVELNHPLLRNQTIAIHTFNYAPLRFMKEFQNELCSNYRMSYVVIT